MGDLNRHIWEGWTPQDFIDSLEIIWDYQSFDSEQEVKDWCRSEQEYYKKDIPEVYSYFINKAYKDGKL